MCIFRLTRLTAAAVALVALAGCAQPVRIMSDLEWARAVTVSRDHFTLQTIIKGGLIESGDSTTFLRSVRSDKLPNLDVIVIYSMVRMRDWKFLDQAFAMDHGKLPLTVLDRDVSACNRYGCALAEHVSIPTTREFLLRYKDTGLNIKLVGKRGEEYIFLPAEYIVAFLASLPSNKAENT